MKAFRLSRVLAVPAHSLHPSRLEARTPKQPRWLFSIPVEVHDQRTGGLGDCGQASDGVLVRVGRTKQEGHAIVAVTKSSTAGPGFVGRLASAQAGFGGLCLLS